MGDHNFKNEDNCRPFIRDEVAGSPLPSLRNFSCVHYSYESKWLFLLLNFELENRRVVNSNLVGRGSCDLEDEAGLRRLTANHDPENLL